MPSRGKGKKKKRSGSTPVSEMDFSAAENFIPPLDIDFNVGPGTSGGGFFDEKIASLGNMGKFQKLIAGRIGGRTYVNPEVENIQRDSVRTISAPTKTKSEQFTYSDGKFVKPDLHYHIQYTKDLQEHYMTGGAHNPQSKLIFPVKPSLFSTYNSLNKQSPMHIEPTFRQVTKADYSAGVIQRYFARKSNQVMSPPFEIAAKQFNSSPLYVYTTFQWRVAGNREIVSKLNTRAIKKAVRDIPNIDKQLNPFQFYKVEAKLENLSKEEVLDRLGVATTIKETTAESTTTTATTTTTSPSTTTTTTQTQTGPPPGVMGGGAGGAGGGGGGGY